MDTVKPQNHSLNFVLQDISYLRSYIELCKKERVEREKWDHQ